MDFNDNEEQIVDLYIQQAKKKQIKQSQVRSRQKTCTIADLNKDELPQFQKRKSSFDKKSETQNIWKLNQNDESLQKYKQSLLGIKNKEQFIQFQEKMEQNQDVEVEFLQIIIICNDRPNGNIILDLTKALGDKQKDIKDQIYTLKEGTIYNMRFIFKVRHDCVYGLKFINNIYKMNLIKGYYSKIQWRNMKNSWEVLRLKKKNNILIFLQNKHLMVLYQEVNIQGKLWYIKNNKFIDDDGICHMQYEYKFKIAKDWQD